MELRFEPNYDAEITIKNEKVDIAVYKRKFLNGLKQLYKVLKPDGFIVFTFHNKEIKIWNIFLKSVSLAGFKVERVIHHDALNHPILNLKQIKVSLSTSL